MFNGSILEQSMNAKTGTPIQCIVRIDDDSVAVLRINVWKPKINEMTVFSFGSKELQSLTIYAYDPAIK